MSTVTVGSGEHGEGSEALIQWKCYMEGRSEHLLQSPLSQGSVILM